VWYSNGKSNFPFSGKYVHGTIIATIGPTNIAGVEAVTAMGATSAGSTSLLSTAGVSGRRALEGV